MSICVAAAWLAACGGGNAPSGATEAAGPVAADSAGTGSLVLTVSVDGRRLESSENIHLVPPRSTVLLGCSLPCEFSLLEQGGAATGDVATTSTTWTGTLSLSQPTSRLTVHARIGANVPVSAAFMTPIVAAAH